MNNIKKFGGKYSWKSVLVKSGIYRNGDTNSSDYVVENFKDAVNLICSLEGLKTLEWFICLNFIKIIIKVHIYDYTII